LPKFVRKCASFVPIQALKIIIREGLYRVALMLTVARKRLGGVPKGLFPKMRQMLLGYFQIYA
jgi:hypothetical protein